MFDRIIKSIILYLTNIVFYHFRHNRGSHEDTERVFGRQEGPLARVGRHEDVGASPECGQAPRLLYGQR